MQALRAPRPVIPETVDPQTVSPSGPQRALKQAGLFLLCAAWVLLGLVGHDPWKTEDAQTFGAAWSMTQQHDLLVPTIAGEPWLDLPPLVPALAAVTMAAFSPPLEPHNAARIAAGLLLAALLLVTGVAARELNGRAYRWIPVLILIGSVGLWDRAHALSHELGQTLGIAVALWGFALALRRPVAGGVALGAGAAIAFLSRGFDGPAWIAITALLLPLCGPAWRTRSYAATAAVALIVAVVIGGAWPLALHARSPDLFAAWLRNESLAQHIAFLRGSGGSFDPLYALRNLTWFAWPALPLVLWTLWLRGRGFNGGLANPGVQIPGVLALVILVGLELQPDPRLINALPLLVPLAMIASLEVDTLKRGYSGALDWFGILTFGLLALLLWGIWIDSYVNGMSLRVARLFRDNEIGYQPSFKLWAMLAAVGLTLVWIALVRPARRSNRRAVLNWAVGVTLLWCLYSTIWLPYLDSRRSYRWVSEELARQLPPGGCVTSRNLGVPQRALLHYFARVITVREESNASGAAECPTLLVQYGRQDLDAPPPDGWAPYWEGRRRGDDTEKFVLYRKQAS